MGEKTILAGISHDQREEQIAYDQAELTELAQSAGAEVLGLCWQNRDKPDTRHYLGKGKLEELRLLCETAGAELVIFNDELSPAQQRRLEESLQTRVLDRTALILDIFAQRAKTFEGQLQVEMAQLRYLSSHLMGQGAALSRLGGGIGTRGPGETKLESDRRRIRGKLHDLSNQLEQVKQQRALQRKLRQEQSLPSFSLIGYTNAGKSTLLNALTAAGTYAENQLFATLDPLTRRLELAPNMPVLLSDTVGFVKNLPHQLIAAFRSTLEEVVEADCLLHVVDISNPQAETQIEAVCQVLKELGAADKPVILVLNKADLMIEHSVLLQRLLHEGDSVAISARNGTGLEKLKALMVAFLRRRKRSASFLIPYTDYGYAQRLQRLGPVEELTHTEEGLQITLYLSAEQELQFAKYRIQEQEKPHDE